MSNLIEDVDILDESKECFLTYAEEVLTDRAIPSAEDGLLSVHRKLIWTMEEPLKMDSKSKYKKSASIVGTTLATSYFHGDTACYGALCKIAQPYLMRYPLVDGDGNLGTQEGNGMEAASRYTNARPSLYADLMMADFKKNIVPLKETYNGEYYEPVVLPSLLPNAIVNGRESIGISMAHNSLPHCLTEVCNAIIKRLEKNNSLTVDEVLSEIKGPDFPLGNVIINAKDVKSAFATGRSSVSLKVRGDYEIKKNEIIFSSIPYRTYRNKIKEQIKNNAEELDTYFDDFSDESNVGVNKLVFKVKAGIDPGRAVMKLFALTDLQTTLSYNMNYIVNGTPKMCSMSNLIDAYVNHQINIIIKIAEFDKEKAEKRVHILNGLIIVLNDINKAITLIRESADTAEAKVKLIETFSLSEEQAKAVLDMKLARLTKLDRNDLIKELEEKKAIIAECNKILTEEIYRNQKLIEKVSDMKKKYGDERRTQLLDLEIPKEEKEVKEIVPENVVVVVTKSGYIKRVPLSNFKVQKRGGVGVKSTDDITLDIIKTNTVDMVMFFTSAGKMYRILADKIPSGTNTTKGTLINDIIKLDNGEKVIAISSLHKKSTPKYIFFITKNGMLKKTYLSEYTKTTRNSGIAAINLKEGDELVDILFQDEEDLIFVTKKGMAIRISTNDINPVGRVAMGIKGMKLAEGDEIVSALSVHKETDKLAIFSTTGQGKKIVLNEITKSSRSSKGVICSKTSVAGAAMVDDNDNLLINGNRSSICISAKDIPEMSRIATGNILIKNNSVIRTITKI